MNGVDEHGRAPRPERLAEAEAERDTGIEKAEAAADPRIILAIDAEIQKAIDSGRRFSANDIRDKFPVSDEHLVGARVRAMSQKRIDGHPLMKPVGYEPSSLKSTHMHPIRTWLGWDAYQALHRTTAAAAS